MQRYGQQRADPRNLNADGWEAADQPAQEYLGVLGLGLLPRSQARAKCHLRFYPGWRSQRRH